MIELIIPGYTGFRPIDMSSVYYNNKIHTNTLSVGVGYGQRTRKNDMEFKPNIYTDRHPLNIWVDYDD